MKIDCFNGPENNYQFHRCFLQEIRAKYRFKAEGNGYRIQRYDVCKGIK